MAECKPLFAALDTNGHVRQTGAHPMDFEPDAVPAWRRLFPMTPDAQAAFRADPEVRLDFRFRPKEQCYMIGVRRVQG